MGGGGPLVQLVSAEERVWCQYVESKVQCCVRSTAVNSVFHYSRLSGLALKRLWSRNIWNGDFSPVRSGSIPRRRVAVAEGTGDNALIDDVQEIVASMNCGCAMVQRPVRRISTRCLDMANLQVTTWRIQPARIRAAGWAGQPKPGPLMRKLWR